VLPPSAGAVEFDTVIAPGGQLTALSAAQRIRMGAQRGGQRAHVWPDEHSVHVLINGELVRTAPSNLSADDLDQLRMRGALPAGAPPASPSPTRAASRPGGREGLQTTYWRRSARYTAPTAPAEGAHRCRVRLAGLCRVAVLRRVAFALEQV
jgi:hypothetical protein